MDNFTQDDVVYVIAEDVYKKERGETSMPMGWYSIDVNKRIDILKEAMDNETSVVNTKGYYDVMEKVITEDNKNNTL
jgi:hypothetical protein